MRSSRSGSRLGAVVRHMRRHLGMRSLWGWLLVGLCAAILPFLAADEPGLSVSPAKLETEGDSAGEAGHREPSPPDVLDVIVLDDGSTDGNLSFDAVVKPAVNSPAELEIEDAGGAKFQSGQKSRKLNLRKGEPQVRERVQVNVAGAPPRSLKVRLRLLGQDGKPWLIMEREVKVNQAEPAEPSQRRVPVVRTLPDGTRMVEYMTSEEAVKRGLPPEGVPAPPSERPQELEGKREE